MISRAFYVLLMIPLPAASQIDIGVKGGLNISNVVMTNFVDPDVEADLGLKSGLHAGLFAQGSIDDRVGMAAELLYSDKGVKGSTNIHLHYIALPLLLRYKLSNRFSAELGPEAAYLFSAKSSHGDLSSTYNNKFDLSLDGGIVFDTPKVVLGIRYCVGLFSVREPFETQTAAGVEKVKYQNRVVQFSLGYKLFILE